MYRYVLNPFTGLPDTVLDSWSKQTEIDFGSTPTDEKTFTVTDANVTAESCILCQVALVAPTGKDLDELEFDILDFKCTPGAGTFDMYVRSLEGLVADKFKINYSFNT